MEHHLTSRNEDSVRVCVCVCVCSRETRGGGRDKMDRTKFSQTRGATL